LTIRVETSLTIARPASEVFEAWVDPAKMSNYFITSGSARLETGKSVVWTWDDHGDARLDIKVTSVEPNKSLRFEWMASGVNTAVEATFTAESESSTTVTVRDGAWNPDAEGIARYGEQMQGWVHMLTCLKAYLEHDINLRT
jgi:uncharacterized protein YndB with AHSA1/START domain